MKKYLSPHVLFHLLSLLLLSIHLVLNTTPFLSDTDSSRCPLHSPAVLPLHSTVRTPPGHFCTDLSRTLPGTHTAPALRLPASHSYSYQRHFGKILRKRCLVWYYSTQNWWSGWNTRWGMGSKQVQPWGFPNCEGNAATAPKMSLHPLHPHCHQLPADCHLSYTTENCLCCMHYSSFQPSHRQFWGTKPHRSTASAGVPGESKTDSPSLQPSGWLPLLPSTMM